LKDPNIKDQCLTFVIGSIQFNKENEERRENNEMKQGRGDWYLYSRCPHFFNGSVS
jgi:lipocalin